MYEARPNKQSVANCGQLRVPQFARVVGLLLTHSPLKLMAKDSIHNVVKTALEKDGWTITDDPLYLNVAEIEVYIDLGAERLLGAEKDNQKIAVEIKTFLNPSALSEFHTVLGQCLNYRLALKLEGSDRTLYLAIPQEAWITFFRREFAKLAIAEYQIKLIVINLAQEEVVKWSP